MSKPPKKPGGRSGGGARDSRGGRDTRGRQRSERGDRPYQKSERPQRGERSFGERSARPSGPRSERPFGERGERKFGDRPQGARSDRPHSDRSGRGERESFGRPRFNRDERPARGDRPERSARPQRSDQPYRGDRPQRAERPQRDERPRQFERRPERSERPHRDHAERGPRADVAVESWGGKRDFRGNDRSERHDRGERGDRPAFKPRKPFGKNWRKPARDPDGPVLLYGWHSVKAALENPARKFHKLLVTENALHRLQDDGVDLPIDPDLVEASEIDAELGPDAVHQGILAEADPLPALDISEVGGDGIILVMDQITDPHNVGAILRTAVAFGVTAIITTQRHSPDMTGVLAKAASGALEYVPMITVTNLARALEALKKNNVFVVGLDSEGDGDIASVPLRTPLALVVGAEGKGLRQLTRATCDQVARLELPGKIKSLNVSNATALALYVAASRVAPG